MFFAFTYAPCVVFVGMSVAFEGKVGKFFKGMSFLFGGAAVLSYIIFIKLLWKMTRQIEDYIKLKQRGVF